jgi:hypothetical protein
MILLEKDLVSINNKGICFEYWPSILQCYNKALDIH